MKNTLYSWDTRSILANIASAREWFDLALKSSAVDARDRRSSQANKYLDDACNTLLLAAVADIKIDPLHDAPPTPTSSDAVRPKEAA